MTYTLTTYRDGNIVLIVPETDDYMYLLNTARERLKNSDDEYEITTKHGEVVAYAMTEDCPKVVERVAEAKQEARDAMKEDHNGA